MKPSPGMVFLAAAATAIAASIVAGFLVLGSPADERARRMDERRVSDLRGVAAAADLYWTRHSRLAASLDELTAEPGVSINTADPVSSEEYAYRTLDTLRYELCATFEMESGEISLDPERDLWAHGSGRQCFQLQGEEITRDER